MIHELKTWPEYYDLIVQGEKRFEVRKNDRDFKVGDILLLKEYNPDSDKFTGSQCKVNVSYILYGGSFGIQEGFCVMSIY